MSLRYRDSSGTETIVSGLTPGGDIEAGAVAQKEGYVEIPSTAAGGNGTATVTFTDGDMPDDNYYVIFRPLTNVFNLTYDSKTKSGFNIQYYNVSNISSGNNIKIYWTAIKTYTVQHAAQNAADIAEIKSAIPAGAGSSNKLVTTTQFNNAVNPLAESVADIQDAVPADASITNKLVSQETLDSELEEADEGIWEAMGKNSAKNYFQSTAIDVGTHGGVTMVRNNDGSFSFSGTCSSETGFSLGAPLQKEDWAGYILSGCPEGGGTTTFYLRRRITDSSGAFIRHDCDYGQGVVLTALGADEYGTISVVIKTGQVMDGVTISPMVRLPQDTDSTYQPYTLTNQQITQQIGQITPSIQSISNPNLLDNAWFTINQRGQTTYTGASAYCVDRWYRNRNNNSVEFDITVNSDGLSIAKLANYGGRLWQKLESINNLAGRTVTMTILYRSTIPGTFGLSQGSGDILFLGAQVAPSSTWTYAKRTAQIPDNVTNIYAALAILNGTEPGTFELKAIKLELGSVSTLVNDIAPNYATELLKCQRYFYRLAPLATDRYGIITMGIILNQTTIRASIPLFVQMRTKPTVVFNLDTDKIKFGIGSSSSFLPITGMSVDNALPSLSTYFTCASQTTFSNGQAVHIWFVDTTSAYIDLSADL